MTKPPSETTKTMSLPEAIRQAAELHRQGRLTEAENVYAAILKAKPDDFDALHLLGVLKQQRGESGEALRLISAALKVKPDVPEALSNFGLVLNTLNRHEEALASFDRAVAIRPDHAEAFYHRGNALRALNRHEEALASYDQALAIRADHAEALYNRGSVLGTLKRHEEALASYDRALAIKPDYAEAVYNRGNMLHALERHEEALASYDRALATRPDHAEALNNRGAVLGALDRYEEALVSFDLALAIRPDYAEALNNRGSALHALKRDEEALDSFEQALAVKPDYFEALNNRANVLQALNRREEALASYDRALAIRPDDADALSNRGNVLRGLKRHKDALVSIEQALAIRPDFAEALYNHGTVLGLLKRYEEATAGLERALDINPDLKYLKGRILHSKMHCCLWDKFEPTAARLAHEVQAGEHTATPFEFLTVSESASDQLKCSQIWAQDRYPLSSRPVWQGEIYRHDKIRIAYLSADYHDHATAYLMAGLFELHDRKRFETIAVSFGADSRGDMRTRLKPAFGRFIDVSQKSDRGVAEMLRELEVDIAVDLKGFTGDSRTGIFALRAAPIQVNYLGYPGTMGADYIDYIIADRWVIPEEQHEYYAEKVVYLPESYQVNDSKRPIAEHTPSRAKLGLPEKGFVFCSFNNNYKITPLVFDIWMRLLRQVEGSVLWLLEGNAAVVRNLKREAEKRGIAPERLVFATRVKLADHLARHRLADLFLDTLPCNAHTTASDALWAGLPVVTCLGATFAGRVAGSLLNAVGLPELIAHSLKEYEALALKLARDKKALAKIRSKLARNRKTCPLFDTDRFRRHIEAAYTTMWERYQRGEPPVSFAVAQIRK